MSTRLVLMSTPGEGLARVLAAARQYLAHASHPVVGYLPAAALGDRFLDVTQAAFVGVADVVLLEPGSAHRHLDSISLLYVPGGNTFVLMSRLDEAGLVEVLRDRLLAGLPYVGFSAGALLAGLDILNSNDANASGCRRFDGLGLVPYSVVAHYPMDDHAERDERIAAYHQYHSTPVLALDDDAVITVQGDEIRLSEGCAITIEPNGARMVLRTQTLIP